MANDAVGFVLVPVGRHSLAHRIALPARSAADPKKRGRFVNGLGGLRAGIDGLGAWRAQLVARRVPDQQDPVALDAYIRITGEEPADRGKVLDEFIGFRRSTPRPA
ncbi:hypothetical protein [Aquihabitans sp. McL0605]|uniref:hypothetical protein n=1 Tax=Aquihabitans sp. McL0605 TaxID=3415671 RepID=UPI003CF3972B